jgi:threonine/homoserine efflux transporter RhtA
MNQSSRTQGGLICIGVAIVGAWFLLGLLQESYWALAIPVAIFVFFILGLSFWVGYTIATIQVEPFEDAEVEAPPATPTAVSPEGQSKGETSETTHWS